MTLVKICGLRTPETLDAALSAGADMVGFVRFPRSPRHVALDVGAELSRQAAGKAIRTLLLVDPTDEALDEAIDAIAPDLIQLHGHESPERTADIARRSGRPIMKALPVSDAGDLAAIDRYRGVASRILLDAKPPKDAVLPGGNGIAFDWRLVAGLARTPLCAALGLGTPDPAAVTMLSGGLTPENVGEAIAVSGLSAVDVSSGVENAPGIKDPPKIAAFVRAARTAFTAAERKVA